MVWMVFLTMFNLQLLGHDVAKLIAILEWRLWQIVANDRIGSSDGVLNYVFVLDNGIFIITMQGLPIHFLIERRYIIEFCVCITIN
jgi:hypothetical protein